MLGPIVLLGPRGEHQLASRQMRALLAHLVAEPGGLSADELIDRVWNEAAPASALSSLRAQISRLRRTMTDVSNELPSIEFEASKYRLIMSEGQTDIAAFRRASAPSRGIESLRAALGLWRGRAFDSLSDDIELMPIAAALDTNA